MRMLSTEKVIMALVLNRAKLRERVLIGESEQVLAALEGQEGENLIYDRERPLGQFLLDWEQMNTEDWSGGAIRDLREALRTRMERVRREEDGKTELLNRAATGDPISVYAANRCWSAYWEQRTTYGFQDRVRPFEEAAAALTKDFGFRLLTEERNYAMQELLDDTQAYLRIHGRRGGVECLLRYPWYKDTMECLIIRQDVLPGVLYYLYRLREWGLCWCCCTRCGRWFLAASRHHGLCGPICRTESGRENKRNHDALSKEKPWEQVYKSCYQRLNKRLNRYRSDCGDPEKIREAEAAFAAFRQEAKLRKKQVESEQQLTQFRDWILSEERKLERFGSA